MGGRKMPGLGTVGGRPKGLPLMGFVFRPPYTVPDKATGGRVSKKCRTWSFRGKNRHGRDEHRKQNS